LKRDQYPCKYCFTSCAIKRKRTTFKPDELATTFVSLKQQKRVDGLFLSSGIVPDANTTMEKMLATVERLRLREGYTGYIHLKLIPGASFEYIERAVELADRSKPGPSDTSLSQLKSTVQRVPSSSRFPALGRAPPTALLRRVARPASVTSRN
jgi:predicted DNA-binding helix-hairpin-helix protein